MTSLLRQIVAGPRSRHPEAGLDLCYMTDQIIITSGPSSMYPQYAYRTPLDQLVKFLDYKHGKEWGIWEFRAEGTGYPDSEVYNRVWHYPFPDHHPPPFGLVPKIMAEMRHWLRDENGKERKGRVVVMHCKAGKGRSGMMACSYLISECGWTVSEALVRFTERRIRPGFGQGVSIASQLRWVGYVNRWKCSGKLYIERQIEVIEVYVWGLREGVKVQVEGFVEEGKAIKLFHTFTKHERILADGAVIFKPSTRVILPSSDINIHFKRQNKALHRWTMGTAHVWFNAYFEGNGPDDNGVFEINWDRMDGIKGLSYKGVRALDRLVVVWESV